MVKKKNKGAKTKHDTDRDQNSNHRQERQRPKYSDHHDHNGARALAGGVVLPSPFPSHLPKPPNGKFIYAHDPQYHESFQAALDGPYEGFVVDNDVLSSGSSIINDEQIERCLDVEMNSELRYFQTDVTQPFGLGTKCAKTYVTRCLVGDPGTTYKYLGLRMFSHPWGSTNMTSPENTIKRLGDALSSRTKTHLEALYEKRRRRLPARDQQKQSPRGRADFDICLINRMEPRHDELKLLSSEVIKNKGAANAGNSNSRHGDDVTGDDILKTSVSWHADSSLENYSTIAVYQTFVDNDDNKNINSKVDRKNPQDDTSNWMVGLRVVHHSEGPTQSLRRGTAIESAVVSETPPIAISLPNRSAYYLLDDFNHHHQHAVILKSPSTSSSKHERLANNVTAGKGTGSRNVDAKSRDVVRYSCTFRLLRESHNVNDWIRRGHNACNQFHKKGLRLFRSEQLLLTEIESDWIRQFYIQGSKHYKLLWDSYWKEPIQELLKVWTHLEKRTHQTIEFLRMAVEGKCYNNSDNGTGEHGSKKERKRRERRKKALLSLQELISRSHQDGREDVKILFESFAVQLEERATMREMWKKREKDHVFREMQSDCRPLEVPFQFSRPLDEKQTGVGSSPLQGEPSALRKIACDIRMLWRAFDESDPRRLPMPPAMTRTVAENQEEHDLPHSKSLEWSGWGEEHRVFGLELQGPFAAAVTDGTKSIETRLYDFPPSLIGKKILILQSPTGKAGVSSLGNTITDFSQIKIIGWCTIKSVKIYETAAAFEADESLHLVSPNSGYSWKQGETRILYGWIVGDCGRFHDASKNSEHATYQSASRRMRSLFELRTKNGYATCEATTEPMTERNPRSRRNRKKALSTKPDGDMQKKKKRRRY